MTDALTRLESRLETTKQALLEHTLYARITNPEALRAFMAQHIFAVWDFMSLLKALQQRLTCVEAPWRPVGDASVRRLINEIVLEEESDEIDGVAIGHFEFYLGAMEQIGADTGPIRRLLAAIEAGRSVEEALGEAGAPQAVRDFVATTFSLIATDKAHVIAASFTFGREDAIVAMFTALESGASPALREATLFRQYLRRHVELDGDAHAPMAIDMLRRLCGHDATKWDEAAQAALVSLEARLDLWTSIEAALPASLDPPPAAAAHPLDSVMTAMA